MNNVKQVPSAFDNNVDTTAVIASCKPRNGKRGMCRGNRKDRPKTTVKAKITPNGKDVQIETSSGRVFDTLGANSKLLDKYN
jgi:hypothetical protein